MSKKKKSIILNKRGTGYKKYLEPLKKYIIEGLKNEILIEGPEKASYGSVALNKFFKESRKKTTFIIKKWEHIRGILVVKKIIVFETKNVIQHLTRPLSLLFRKSTDINRI